MAHATSPDPAVPVDDESSDPDYQAHVRTFNAFLSVLKWFVIHLAILLVALYCGAIAGQPWLAVFLIACSIGLLVFGMLNRPSVRADVMKGLAAAPGSGRHVDRAVGAGDRKA